jgi:hypothetical protein
MMMEDKGQEEQQHLMLGALLRFSATAFQHPLPERV